ncbi:hypothetical protein KC315_g5438 [Hortaea werneckii]|nr:hypothetical protein KC315_g5438 [Hortaea werneckii]
MSYYQGGQYQQPFQNQPPYDQYVDQYGQPYGPPPGQNDSYAGQYGSQPAYPGQPTYDQYQGGGGPVQQLNASYSDSYHSPRSTSFGDHYGSPQQQYDPQNYQPSYNPQAYAQQSPQQSSIPGYNPQAYASPTQSHYGQQQYNPAAYAETPAGTNGSAATAPYGYSPAMYSGSTFSPPQTAYGQSPPQTYSPHQQYNPQLPSHPYSSYGQPSMPPQRSATYYTSSTTSPQVSMPYPTSTESHGRPHSQSFSTSTRSLRNEHRRAQVTPQLSNYYNQTTQPSPPSRQSPSPLRADMLSPPNSTPGPTPPAHTSYGSYGQVSRSNTLDRHPQSRPLPGPPEPDIEPGYFQQGGSHEMTHEEAEALSQEELFSQVENAVRNAGSARNSHSSRRSQGRSPSISIVQPPYPTDEQPTPLFTAVPPQASRMGRQGSVVNGHLSPASASAHAPPEPQYSDESDAEAAQGLAMMQMAEEDDRRRQSVSGSMGGQTRFNGYGSLRQPRSTAAGGASDSDDYGAVDVSALGGGYDVGAMSYGGDPSQLTVTSSHPSENANGVEYTPPVSSQHSSMRRSHASQSSQISARSAYNYQMDSVHPFPPFNPDARVDAGGTGGLAEPTSLGRRQSYDEGDEFSFMEGTHLPDRFPDEPPDIYFQQAGANYMSGRPLPAPPSDDLSAQTSDISRTSSIGQMSYQPHAVDPYMTNAQGQWVPRSTSLISHQTTPQVPQPLRSKTDAEQRRQLQRSSTYALADATPSTSIVPDLPSLGAKRFVPSKLGAPEFKKCEEPWSLMSILKWLLTIVGPEQYTELKEAEVKEALVALFTNKVPTMNIADAEGLSTLVVSNMYQTGTLATTEEWVKIVPGVMSGVIYQLTGAGCYSPTLHNHIEPGRCYSRHCQRTLKKVNLQTQPIRTGESWAEFYKLTKEDLEGKDRKELERQNVLHEIVQTEDVYMEQMNVLRTLYRDTLIKADPSIISPKRREKFLRDVFGRADAVKQANEDHLLPQLKYRQQEQGPWVVGFSDIFRQWIRKAKQAYLDYAGGFPSANFLVRQELDRNIDFRIFIDRASKDKRTHRLSWDTFLKAPITRLQRYTLLLGTVIKNMKVESEEKRNLQTAYDEVKSVTLECDARVAEMQRKVDLTDLTTKLVLRPGMHQAVELNLDHFGRVLIHRGDLQRMGGNRFTWLDSHALLFDHYLVLAKTVAQRSEQGGRQEKYDVSRLPIPMDLLILESTNDPPVQKSSYVKGLTSVSTVSGRTATPADTGITRTQSATNLGPGSLQQANTGASTNSLHTVTSLGEGKDSEKIMYPFKIKHLGREVYTLFAPNEQARRDWCTKIVEAKTRHAAALHAQHAEPFTLRVMADSAFVYDAFGLSGASRSVTIKGTPVDRALNEVEQRFKDTGRPGPICRARVNCATSFTTAYPAQRRMVAVGTDFGVYISEQDNPRGWSRAIQLARVTQISVLEEFNLFLLIADKALIAYHLDLVCPTDANVPAPRNNDSGRKAPQKLSGSKDVGFFVSGRMKDRQLVFYKKRENLASVFKVLEPIYQKSTEKRRGIFKRGNTEFFREYDDFYIPAECTGVNLFNSSLAVSTSRGFEVLTLDKKVSSSVPDLKAPHVQNIAQHIKDQKALAMLRLSDQEFLLCYSNCAVYVNKHGDVSRSVIMDFVGYAQAAALHGAYLVLFDNDFVEIRNAQNGRLKQIISGREIKCLDDGGSSSAPTAPLIQHPPAPPGSGSGANGALNGSGLSGPDRRTVKFVMQHPELERTQIVVELLLNENMKE